MKYVRSLVTASTLALLGSTGWAVDAHHPEAAASAASDAKALDAAPAQPAAQEVLKKADQQMMAMSEMHEKMMNAKTPEERSALMAEHMKAMQGGMAMMGMMGGMGGKSGMQGGMQGGMPADMATRHQMIEKRMDMMQMMMQMMMDRMPAPAAK